MPSSRSPGSAVKQRRGPFKWHSNHTPISHTAAIIGHDCSQPHIKIIEQSKEFYQKSFSIYQGLETESKQIRLARILPGEYQDEVIRIELFVVSLDDHVDYAPLSYAWDADGSRKTIQLQDTSFIVTGNQYAMLRQFRLPDRERIVWMDFVCINQADIVERKQQVGIMRDIYGSGTSTQVWLGIPDESWDRRRRQCFAPENMKNFWRQVKVDLDCGDREKDFDRSEEGAEDFDAVDMERLGSLSWQEAARYILEILGSKTHFGHLPWSIICAKETGSPWWEGIASVAGILRASWWYRVWVLQEVALSKGEVMLHMGDFQMPMDLMQRALRGIASQVNTCCAEYKNLWTLLPTEAMQAIIHGHSFMSLLGDFQTNGEFNVDAVDDIFEHSFTSKASDPHDHVFGVLGLLEGLVDIPVEYECNMPRLRERVSAEVLEKLGLLWLDQGIGRHFPFDERLASWSLEMTVHYRRRFSHTRPYYSWQEAMHGRSLIFHPEERALEVIGSSVDIVDKIIWTFDLTEYDYVKPQLEEWLAKNNNSKSCRWDDKRMLTTMMWGCDPRGVSNAPFTYSTPPSMNAEGLEAWRLILSKIKYEERLIDKDYQLTRSFFILNWRSPVVYLTKGGRLGMGPLETKPGDKVVKIRGSGFAMMLRDASQPFDSIRKRFSNGSYVPKYSLIGSCYMEGYEDVAWKTEHKDASLKIV